MLEENISEKSGFVRLALGIGLTACGISHLVKENGNKILGMLSITAGSLKIAEGIFLYCPTKAMFSNNVKNAVTTSMQEFMDGDSLMTAFNSRYNSGNQNSNGGNGSTMQQMTQTAAKVAETVANTTQSGTMMEEAAKAIQGVTNNANQKKSK